MNEDAVTRLDFECISNVFDCIIYIAMITCLWNKKWYEHSTTQFCPKESQCGKLGQFAMPDTCENWLGLVNSYVYHAHQTPEIYRLLLDNGIVTFRRQVIIWATSVWYSKTW